MGASIRVQIQALSRKNIIYQKRRIGANVCLILTPVFVIGLAFSIQMAARVMLAKSTTCGCMCTLCCEGRKCRIAGPESQCDLKVETCKRVDKSQCGFRFSTEDQSLFCAVKHPSSWSPILKVRRHMRPGGLAWKNGLGILYHGEDSQVAKAIMEPTLSNLGRLDQRNFKPAKVFLDEIKQFESEGEFVLRGEGFTKVGLRIGSSTSPKNPMFLDEGFIGIGSSGAFISHDCAEVNLLYPMVDDAVGGLEPLLDRYGGGLGYGSASSIHNGTVICSSPVVKYESHLDDLVDKLYCVWRQARCSDDRRSIDGTLIHGYTNAWDLKDSSKDKFNLGVWQPSRGLLERQHMRPNLAQNMPAEGWLRWVTGDEELSASLLAVQETPKGDSSLNFDMTMILGPLLFTWVVGVVSPLMLVHIVYEKEQGMEVMMRMMGMHGSTNLVVLYIFYFIIYSLYIATFMIAGTLTQWSLFVNNSYGLQILFYFITGHTMLAFTFLLSCFFKKSGTANAFANVWIIGNGLIAFSFYSIMSSKKDQTIATIMELLPSIAVYRGLWEFSAYADFAVDAHTTGMKWSNLGDEGNGMMRIWLISVIEWFVFLLIAWAHTNEKIKGAKKLLGLLPKRAKKAPAMRKLTKSLSGLELVPTNGSNPRMSDYSASICSVVQIECQSSPHTHDPIHDPILVTRDLRKVFKGIDGSPPKVAVSKLTMSVEKGEVFGLLGPNGAGKSTALNLLVGFEEPTSGTAYVDGMDIQTEKRKIYGRIGLCPQENRLWDTLTGREHLMFYGQLKGINKANLDKAVNAALASVDLLSRKTGDRVVGEYSGGMKRRLCVAMALIGKPSVVYLDEPSTGMDLYSRRQLWAAVREARKHSCVVLTTHSMEEAEALCDRIGIFVSGQLVTLGSPKQLKARYGEYTVLTLTVPAHETRLAMMFIMETWESAVLVNSIGGVLKFKLPRDVELSHVFAVMNDWRHVKVMDWSVNHASLEEVFVRIVEDCLDQTEKLEISSSEHKTVGDVAVQDVQVAGSSGA